jgi:hypothetical protein
VIRVTPRGQVNRAPGMAPRLARNPHLAAPRRAGQTWAGAGTRRPVNLVLSMYFACMARKRPAASQRRAVPRPAQGKCAIVPGAAADMANGNRGRVRGCTEDGGIR